MRADQRFEISYAPKSLVFHKGGASIGAVESKDSISWTADYYYNKNRMAFTMKDFPQVLFSVCIGILATVCKRGVRMKLFRAMKICLLMLRQLFNIKKGPAPNKMPQVDI